MWRLVLGSLVLALVTGPAAADSRVAGRPNGDDLTVATSEAWPAHVVYAAAVCGTKPYAWSLTATQALLAGYHDYAILQGMPKPAHLTGLDLAWRQGAVNSAARLGEVLMARWAANPDACMIWSDDNALDSADTAISRAREEHNDTTTTESYGASVPVLWQQLAPELMELGAVLVGCGLRSTEMLRRETNMLGLQVWQSTAELTHTASFAAYVDGTLSEARAAAAYETFEGIRKEACDLAARSPQVHVVDQLMNR